MSIEIPDVAMGTSEEIDAQSIYSTAMYLPLHKIDVQEGETVQAIINRCNELAESRARDENGNLIITESDQVILDSLQTRVNYYNQEYYNGRSGGATTAQIGNLSWQMQNENGERFDPYGMSAASFQRTDGSIDIAYRGTPNKSWFDNGKGYTKFYGKDHSYDPSLDLTPMQVWALQYADLVVADYLDGNPHGVVRFTGHSAGGNRATLASILMGDKYPGHIMGAVSFDGQHISPELWDQLEAYLDDGLDYHREKLVGIYGQDDYVSALRFPGKCLVPDDQIIYIQQEGSGQLKMGFPVTWLLEYFGLGEVFGAHAITSFWDESGGWRPVADGPGLFPQFIMDMLAVIETLPDDQRDQAANTMMALLQDLLGSGMGPIGEEDLSEFKSMNDYMLLIKIIRQVLQDPKYHEAAQAKAKDIQLKMNLLVAAGVLSLVFIGIISPIGFISAIGFLLAGLLTFIAILANSIIDWFFNSIPTTVAISSVRINTDLMRDYSQSLNNDTGQLYTLYERVNGLLWEAGSVGMSIPRPTSLMDLYKAILAAGTYVSKTTDAFEKAEKKVLKNV